MRILHIGKYYPPVPGGMERFLGDLVNAQRAQGDEVAVLVHEDASRPGRDDPPWLMRCPVWLRLVFAPISPAFGLWLHRAIHRHRPDVLHIHMPSVSAFWAFLVPAAWKCPWVLHWQSDVEPSRIKLALRIAYPHYSIFERALLEAAESVIVTSPQYLETSAPLQPWRAKCHVIPLGVDPQRLPGVRDAHEGELWSGHGLRVLAAGRLTYYKGFETLVDAVLASRDLELVLVGEGDERPKLERMLRKAGSPGRIRLAGEVDDDTLHRLMASCDVFCLPSRERTEAFGLVLVEAMRYGKAIVASDLPGSGVSWVARDGENAVLVEKENVAAWRDALERLARNPAQRRLLGQRGAERYARDFDIANVVRSVRSVYAISMKLRAEDSVAQADTSDPEIPVEQGERIEPPLVRSGRLLVVIPALNEAACIGGVIARARAHPGVDVLVVDDGSTDDTASVAASNGARVVCAPLWQGAWGAIQTGMRYAMRHGYSAVVTMDADGQHEPEYLPELIAAAAGADVVIAACPSRGSHLRHLAWAYFRFLTGLNLDDLTSGFRYYNARAYRLLASEEATLLDYQDIGVLLLLLRANLAIREVPVAMNPRRYGASRVFSSWWTVGSYMAETTLVCLARWNQGPRKSMSHRQ